MRYDYTNGKRTLGMDIKIMKRLKVGLVGIATSALVLGMFALPAFAANNGNGTDQFGPIAGASQDSGTCGNFWANDTYNLFFTVHNNGDGTFTVRTAYKDASFTTLDGQSPGACETPAGHGSTVTAGINGNFQGFLDGTVVGGTYNPNADLSGCATTPCTRTQVISDLFGPSATYSIASYNFEYSSPNSTLLYRSWHENFNANSVSEQDTGDIANL
jgi:hypothetical protein